jgi:Raf kinase inhibitor-like YbhB/YbcL family protein
VDPVEALQPTAAQVRTAEDASDEELQPTAVQDQPVESEVEREESMSFKLASEAFAAEEAIPSRYSCDGEDISPALSWHGTPEGTQSFALIFDDPDAPVGTWVHWVLFNIPAEASGLPEGIAPESTLADGSVHGVNSWSSIGYGGPCPPGGTHRYFFKLYALDTMLDLAEGASKDQLLAAMEDNTLAEIQLMGTYTR